MKKPAIAHPVCDPRGSRNEACVVVVECEEDGVKASENVPTYPRYGESGVSHGANYDGGARVAGGPDARVSSASVAGRRGTQRD